MDAKLRAVLDERTRYDAAGAEPRIFEPGPTRTRSTPSPTRPGEPYCIALPPPNVTGSLHMGHALNGTVQDAAHPPEAHAGPQRAVAAAAPTTPASRRRWSSSGSWRAKGLTREELGREEFVERVWEWRADDRQRDHRAVQAARLVDGLPARAVHDGRRLRAGRDRGVRAAARARATSTATAASSTGRGRSRRRSPTSRSSTARSTTCCTRSRYRRRGRRRDRDRDRAAGDDPGRHRRRRAPRRPALAAT